MTHSLTPSELEYARMALERRLVTARQVRACEERRAQGDLSHLASLLTSAGAIEASVAAALLREVHREITRKTTLALSADLERYLEAVQLGATRTQAPRRRRTLRLATGVAATALVLVSGGLASARWHRAPVCCSPTPHDELQTFVVEVDNQVVNARSQLSSAGARRRDGDPGGARADAEEALRLLDALPALVRDFTPALRPALEAHLRERQPDVDALRVDAYLELGRGHATGGEPEDLAKALVSWRQALELAPGSSAVLLEVGKVQARQGEHEEARRTLQSIVDADAAHVEARLELGLVHELAGDDEAALECFTRVIEQGGRPARAHLLRGQARLRLGLAGTALEDLERVIELEDDSFAGFLWLGRAHQACGDFGEAQEAITEAIDLNPSLPDGYAARAELYAAQRKHAEAIKDFEVALSRSPVFHTARLGLARALEAVLDDERARATYEELLQATDREAQTLAPVVHAALGELALVDADPFECEREARAEARRRAAAADDTLGPWPPLAQTREEAARLQADRLRAAADHFSRALALEPALVPALLGRGRLGLARGALDAAQTDLRAAVAALERRPRSAPREQLARAQALLGLIALRRGQPAPAREAFALALEAQPTCPLALAGQGHAALLAGDAAAAAGWLARARELDASPGASAADESTHFTLEGERQAGLARRSRRPEYYTAARRCFARAVASNPLDARADLARARLCGEWGSWDEAVALTERAVASDPASREAHERLGFLFARDLPLERDAITGHPEHLRDPIRAEAHFGDALALARPDAASDVDASCDALFGRALARSTRDPADLPGARADLRDALRASPTDLRQATPARLLRSIEALDLLAATEERLGDADAARASRERAVALRQGARAAARDELRAAEQLRDRLDYSTAIKRLDHALELDPALSGALHTRGTCYLKLGNFVPGILDLSRALELEPRLADAFFLKVYQLSYVVDLNRVVTELTKIVSDHPNASHVVFLRGFFYVAKTELKRFDRLDVERGLADLDRCLELNPAHVTALLYRGLLRLKAASFAPDPTAREACYDRALADYLAALALDPASGLSHYLQALLWSVRSTEPDLAPLEVALRKRRALDALRASLGCEFEATERVKNERWFDPLRAEPGFVELMRGR